MRDPHVDMDMHVVIVGFEEKKEVGLGVFFSLPLSWTLTEKDESEGKVKDKHNFNFLLLYNQE